MDALGRDDESARSRRSSTGRGDGGMAALVLEGEAGIGKSTLWLAGVEAARERGLRVLSSRPAEVELGVAHAALGDLLEDALGDVLPELAAPRRRALETALLLGEDAGEPVDARTLAVAVRDALQLLAERRPILLAIDDVQWLDASSANALVFAVRRLPEQNIRLLLARRLADGIPVSELELALDDRHARAPAGRPVQPGRAAGDPAATGSAGRSRGRRCFACTKHRAGTRSSRSSSPAPSATNVDPTQPLPVPETLEALVRARLDGLPDETRRALLLACTHGRLTPAQLDGDALEPAFADNVIELADGVIRFTHPLLASVLYQAASPERSAPRARAIGRDRRRSARTRAPSRACGARAGRRDRRGARGSSRCRDRTRRTDRRSRARGARPAGDASDASEDRHRRALATARAHLASGEGTRPRAIALELLPRLRRARRARRRSSSCPSSRERSARSRSWKRRWTMRPGTRRSRCCCTGNSAVLGRLTKGMEWAQRHARVALDLADSLGDDALRAGALSALAFLRFNGGDPDAPRDAERAYELALACGDQQQLHRAESMLGHVLGWSVHTERARAPAGVSPRRCREHDERVAASALWHLAVVEWRAGRWVLAEDHAEGAFAISSQYGSRPRSTCSRSRSWSPIAATSSVPVSSPSTAARSPTRKEHTSAGWSRSRASSTTGSGTPVRLRRSSQTARPLPMRRAGASRTYAGGAPTTQRR